MPEQDILTGDGAADLTGATGEDIGAAGQPAAEENAELAAFKAKAEDEVAKRQAVEEENRRLNEQLLAVANPAQTQQAPKGVFDDREGYENVTVDDILQSQAQQTQQTQQLLTNIQFNNFITANPDFSEIVGTYRQDGRLNSAQSLKDLIKDNPQMRVLENLPATAAPYVYQMAKQYKELTELRAQQAANTEHQTTVGVENKLTPLSPAAVGGGGGAGGTEPTDEQVDKAWEAAERGDFG